MGWGDCGTDSEGRNIGYVWAATCDEPGCDKAIDRGLSYACGDMHGTTEAGCEKYFCEDHRRHYVDVGGGRHEVICNSCKQALLDTGEWVEDEEEGCFVRKDQETTAESLP